MLCSVSDRGRCKRKRGDLVAINIRLGICNEDPRKLDKRPNFEISSPVTVAADIKDSCSLNNPQFIFTASLVDVSRYNYIHVAAWHNRYYFIDDFVVMPGSRIMIRCSVDPLTSNADDILQLTALVSRSENQKSAYLPNENYHAYNTRACVTLPFDRTPFSANYSTDQVYLLTVMGGAHS